MNDINDDLEGASTFRWLVGNSPVGNDYSPYPDAVDKSFIPPEILVGRYVRFEVTPVDAREAMGAPVLSPAVEILGKTAVKSLNATSQTLVEGGKLNATAEITNHDIGERKAVLIICLVGENDGMIRHVYSKTVSVNIGETKVATLDQDIVLGSVDGLRAEIYVWDSFTGQPLKKPVIVE